MPANSTLMLRGVFQGSVIELTVLQSRLMVKLALVIEKYLQSDNTKAMRRGHLFFMSMRDRQSIWGVGGESLGIGFGPDHIPL